ncbi:MAG: TOBE domain-containing protein, partial [Actinobacteria bacterium]|nr:TOBE domain-containing protein [Actinomycetota bacterium]
RQRVALARAIVRHPAVFCMDEPLSNLDAKLRSDTRSELVSLHRRLSSTFIYVTHDQVEAMTMGTHVAVMHRGRIEQIGVPSDVYARPETVFVAQFIGTPPMNIFPAGMVEPGDRLVGVRPEHLSLDPAADLRMSVGLVELLGHETLVHGHVGETPVVARLAADVTPPSVGDEAGIVLPVAHRHRFDAATGRRIAESTS